MIKTVVFDFDGVLVDSNKVKYNAWFKLFPPSENISPELIKDALERIKVTRVEIITEIFRRLGKPLGEMQDWVDLYVKKFGQIVEEEIANMGLIPGVKESLESLAKNYSLYINSSTPEAPLIYVVRKLGIRSFFAAIFGRPAKKDENLRMIMEVAEVLPEDIVMIGDAEEDWEAAKKEGTRFIGIAHDWNGWKNREFLLVSSVPEAEKIIQTMQ